MKKFFIAGVKFHQYKMVEKDLVEGMELILNPEPTNKYDPNAVRIETMNGVMLGYVPKKFSSEICAQIDTGLRLTCEITKIDLEAKAWEKFEVTITSSEEDNEADEVREDDFPNEIDFPKD